MEINRDGMCRTEEERILEDQFVRIELTGNKTLENVKIITDKDGWLHVDIMKQGKKLREEYIDKTLLVNKANILFIELLQ